MEKIIDRSVYDLTTFKLRLGKLTLKMYDKGDRVLRVEIVVNNIAELRCGKAMGKLPGMLKRLQEMVVAFLGVVQAAHLSFVDGRQLDALAAPSVRGVRRTAGVDLQKPRMRAVAEAVMALAAKPEGFTAADLCERVRAQKGRSLSSYRERKAAYDLHKLRAKSLVERIAKTRRYRVRKPGIRTLAALSQAKATAAEDKANIGKRGGPAGPPLPSHQEAGVTYSFKLKSSMMSNSCWVMMPFSTASR